MKILVLNGPNINMLGVREPDIYGKENFATLQKKVQEHADARGVTVRMVQTNHEGVLVDEIQQTYRKYQGIVINPGAYTHTSIAILDAVKAVGIPTVEVHISKVEEREDFRQISYAGKACIKTYMGLGLDGYRHAILCLKLYLENARHL